LSGKFQFTEKDEGVCLFVYKAQSKCCDEYKSRNKLKKTIKEELYDLFSKHDSNR